MKLGIPVVLVLALGAGPAWAAVDRKPPTTPTNLRVTGTTAYSVSLAWNPSTDNSGSFHYIICCSSTASSTVPGTVSSFTFTAGLESGRSYTLRIVAIDAAGNASKYSNSVTVTLPRDTVPPTTPLVSVTGVGPTHVALAWASTDNGPNIWYSVSNNGAPVLIGTRATAAVIPLLEPETTYTFVVGARDFAGLSSPLSDPTTVTTPPSNPADVTAPTTPANFYGQNWGCEVELTWSESTDDLDPQFVIEYQIFVNDVYDHSLALRFTRTIVYGTMDGSNTFSIVAVDSAGNKSVPATFTMDLVGCVS
jgi:chitodextrinase